MNLKEIRALLDFLREYGLTEVEVERGGDRIRLRREAAAPPPAATAGPPMSPTAPAPEAVREDRRQHLVTVEAPMVGTFYRAPSPDAEPYVREGDAIKEGQVLCIIEAMKLMNEIESKVGGRIIRVLVENGQPVEYGQPLFLIEP
ncbi:MAG TPA: acetyl-CoA carboxylase biotin carboxyl carrier protein [Methylomirabilota bacterium]|jgi:acetyl-CoA carboxylase biotin carboxyl carrier protein|nr:acetyl-CoA carboxylase biotin carboxyl carrier protein [Methylomirabilota bacterium]